MLSFLHYICFINFAPMQTLNITLPTSWSSLTDHQLHVVYTLFADEYTSAEVKALCLLKWNHLKVAAALHSGLFLIKSGRREFVLTAHQISTAASTLDFLDTIPSTPIRISRIGKHRAAAADFEKVPFEQYLYIENLFQGYINTQRPVLLHQIAEVLYDCPHLHTTKAHLVGTFYWIASLKQYFAREFPNFYRPAAPASEANLLGAPEQSTYSQLRDSTNAMIRALTGGDITKESHILKMDTWRALTELDAKAREAEELRKLTHHK